MVSGTYVRGNEVWGNFIMPQLLVILMRTSLIRNSDIERFGDKLLYLISDIVTLTIQ